MKAPDADGNGPVTGVEAAGLLMMALEAEGWTFSLDALGRLRTVIGDPLPGSTIASALETLNRMSDSCRLLLCEPRGVH